MKEYSTGATRNGTEGKLQYSRFLDAEVQKRYCEYMEKHRIQKDGKLRAPDNWKKGIDIADYMDSLDRHEWDLLSVYQGYDRYCPDDGHKLDMMELLLAIRFNVDGMIYELIKEEENDRAE
jgi:hypothetical protein